VKKVAVPAVVVVVAAALLSWIAADIFGITDHAVPG